MQQTKFYLFCIFLLFAGFTTAENSPEIISKNVSFGFKKSSGRNIDTIIIHSVYNASGGEIYDVDLIIRQFGRYHVSPHYLIDREGKTYSMVNENDIAYHAGKSALPDGSVNVNTRSVGIEVITSLEEAPADAQMKALVALVKDLKSRYQIKYVLRHSDIAPDRKTDPWNFDWNGFTHLIQNAAHEE